MPLFDHMHVNFINEIQKQRYEALSLHLMAPTRYLDEGCLEVLGLEPSVRFLCHQLNWEEYTDSKNETYLNLTLEFLSSLDYDPYVDPASHISFRLFRKKYAFNHKEFSDLLGFLTYPDVRVTLGLLHD